MRRRGLILLIAVPNSVAALLAIISFVVYPAQGVVIGTFATVVIVAYGALAAPWISGYLDDKKEHSRVLNELVFSKFDWLNLGQPGIDRQLSRAQFLDDWPLHSPMKISGSYWGKLNEREVRFWMEIEKSPGFDSALDHIRSYPWFDKHWKEAVEIEAQYNQKRPEVLRRISDVARRELLSLYPGMGESMTSRGGVPAKPFFDVATLNAVIYLRIESDLGYDRSPVPPLVETPHHSGQRGVGLDENAQIVVSNDARDLDISKLSNLVKRLAMSEELRSGVQELKELEKAGYEAIERVQKHFQKLSVQIALGHRIAGTCKEIGY